MNPAGLSIDVDSVASHLAGYGLPAAGNAAAAYRVAIPRALELFHRLGVRATFFLIASEATAHPDVVRRIVREGHEVASHSLTHCLPFPRERGPLLQREVGESKALLEALSGMPVIGFRAPSWEFSPALVEELAEAGYRYDASVYPSPLLFALRHSVAGRSEGAPARGVTTWRDCTRSASVDSITTSHGQLAEVPVCVTPMLRVPYYHTLRLMLPGVVQRLIGAWARSRRDGVSYCFHAVDFLAVEQDGLDPRIARHPGMRMPLGYKLQLAEEATKDLAHSRDVVPLGEMIAEELQGWDEPTSAEVVDSNG